MPVKRKPDQSIIEALNKAQHIAFGPVLFRRLPLGFYHIFQKRKTPKTKPPVPVD